MEEVHANSNIMKHPHSELPRDYQILFVKKFKKVAPVTVLSYYTDVISFSAIL